MKKTITVQLPPLTDEEKAAILSDWKTANLSESSRLGDEKLKKEVMETVRELQGAGHTVSQFDVGYQGDDFAQNRISAVLTYGNEEGKN